MVFSTRLLLIALVPATLLATGCITPAGSTDWEVAVVELQNLADEVQAAGDVNALAGDGETLLSISAQVAAGMSARGTLTDTACASLGAYWRGGQAGAPKKSFGQKLGSFAKGVALGVVGGVVPGANILSSALKVHSGGSFGDTPGLSGGDMASKMQSYSHGLDTLLAAIREQGVGREQIGDDFFQPGHPGALARELLAHELPHVVQQRGNADGAKLPADLQEPVDMLLELERLDTVIETELAGFRTGIANLNAKLDLFLASDDTCLAATAAQLVKLHEALQLESRRFQTLSNASKTRHDIALNAIRNMK